MKSGAVGQVPAGLLPWHWWHGTVQQAACRQIAFVCTHGQNTLNRASWANKNDKPKCCRSWCLPGNLILSGVFNVATMDTPNFSSSCIFFNNLSDANQTSFAFFETFFPLCHQVFFFYYTAEQGRKGGVVVEVGVGGLLSICLCDDDRGLKKSNTNRPS